MMSVVDHRRALHRMPEIASAERQTQQYILQVLEEGVQSFYCQDRVTIQTWETGILVHFRGTAASQTLGWRAEMEGERMFEHTFLPYCSKYQGNMHARGHDVHMAIALSACRYFMLHQPKNHLVFFFQPGDTRIGGAKAFQESPLYDEWKPDKWFALRVDDKLAAGEIQTKPGPMFGHSRDIEIVFTGKTGHAAYPENGINSFAAATSFLQQAIPLTTEKRASEDGFLSFGKVEAGSSRNTIPQTTVLRGNVRSAEEKDSLWILEQVRTLAQQVKENHACKVTVIEHTHFPAVANWEEETSPLLVNEETGVNKATFDMASDDFGHLIKDTPGCLFKLGVECHHGVFTDRFSPKEEALEPGRRFVIHFLNNY